MIAFGFLDIGGDEERKSEEKSRGRGRDWDLVIKGRFGGEVSG